MYMYAHVHFSAIYLLNVFFFIPWRLSKNTKEPLFFAWVAHCLEQGDQECFSSFHALKSLSRSICAFCLWMFHRNKSSPRTRCRFKWMQSSTTASSSPWRRSSEWVDFSDKLAYNSFAIMSSLICFEVRNVVYSTLLLSQTTLRTVLGTRELKQVLLERDEMQAGILVSSTASMATSYWWSIFCDRCLVGNPGWGNWCVGCESGACGNVMPGLH